MYDMLTIGELIVLQSVLFEGTEDAYRIADPRQLGQPQAGPYREVHNELGNLFIEAGTELLHRLDQRARAA
jgi:hypothetical protein